MKPEEHDAVFARTSHLPHAISATLAAMTDYERLRTFLGTGFESVARLAGGDPVIWRDIFMTNRVALCEALADYERTLKQLHDALSDNDADAVFRFLEQAKNASRQNRP
jgi:3-phosphoshikimate 1-carboxyvinyltransferase